MLTRKLTTVGAVAVGALPAAMAVTQVPVHADERTSSVPCNWYASNGLAWDTNAPYANSYSASGLGPDLCTQVGARLKYKRSDGTVAQTAWVYDSVGSVYYAEARGSGSVVESYHRALDGTASSGIITLQA